MAHLLSMDRCGADGCGEGLSAHALAKALRLTPSRVNDIVLERRGITADTAVRLARYFGGDAQFWLNMNAIYELRTVERSPDTKRAVREIEPRATAEEVA